MKKYQVKVSGLVENVQNKNTSVKQIEISINNLSDIDKLLTSPEIQNSTKLADMNLEYQTLQAFFSSADLNPLETDMVQTNYDAVNKLKKFVEDSRNNFIDVKAKLQDSGNFIDNVLAYGFDDFEKIKTHDALAFLRVQPEFMLFLNNNFRLSGNNIKNEPLLNTENIEKLEQLRLRGLLTDEEFNVQKMKISRL